MRCAESQTQGWPVGLASNFRTDAYRKFIFGRWLQGLSSEHWVKLNGTEVGHLLTSSDMGDYCNSYEADSTLEGRRKSGDRLSVTALFHYHEISKNR